MSIQVNVDADGNNIPGDAANEPSIAVDPINPNKIAIGWRQFNTVGSDLREAGVAYSRDAGRTWTFPGVLEPGIFRSDPVLAADAEGTFYYYSIQCGFNGCGELFRSHDGGMTWQEPIFAHGGDKPWMTIDQTEGIGRGNVYVQWGGLFSRSTDGGATFEVPIEVPDSPRWSTLDVALDGALYVVGAAFSRDGFRFARSSNAQDPNETPLFELVRLVDLGGVTALSGPNFDGIQGQPWVAIDRSDGPMSGNVYVFSTVVGFSGGISDPTDVTFARSEDGGDTWSAPLRINDDPPDNAAWQWFGTMSVAPNGRIDTIWNDTRNSLDDRSISELFYSFSTDGGRTWSINEPLSEPWDSSVGYPAGPGNRKIGDYYHMVSDNVGANLAWAATFNGEQDVYFLRIGDFDCNGNGIGDMNDISSGTSSDLNGNGIPDECEPLGDLNCDGQVNAFDIEPFLLALFDPEDYVMQFPECDIDNGDIDGDGSINAFDIELFLLLIFG